MTRGPTSLLISGSPISGESFYGYVLRLTQWNCYDKISWILNRVGIPFNQVNLWRFEKSVDLMPLARLTGTDRKELASLLYSGTNLRSKKTGLFFGYSLSQYRIRKTSPKLCPGCLVEADYHRKIWDLAYVTCCPAHKCLLLDTCPNCGKRISWHRSRVSICTCNYDWRKVVPTTISDEDLKLTRHVFRLCGISNRDEDSIDETNPLFPLGLEDLLSAVTFMSAQFGMVSDSTGKRSLPSKSNEELNKFLSRGFAVFEEWPTRYYHFLEQRRTALEGSKISLPVSKPFASFVQGLVRSFSSEQLRFMNIAFEHYLKEHWNFGVLFRSSLRFTGSDPTTKRYLSRNEAISYLGTTLFWINKMSEEGRLTIARLPGAIGRLRVGLIRRSELDEVKKYLNELVNAPDAEKLLGISTHMLLELVQNGCLMPVYQPPAVGYRLFRSGDIKTLLSRIRAKIIPPCNPTDKLLTFSCAIAKLRKPAKFALFVQAILEDKIAPSREVKGVGLNRFLFAEAQVKAFMAEYASAPVPRLYRANDLPEPFSAEEVGIRFGVNSSNVFACIHKGLLPTQKLYNGRRLYRISEEAINCFESTYIFCGKMVKNLATSPRAIVEILKEKGVHPVLDPQSYSHAPYIFRRADIEHLDLGELLRVKKMQLDPRGAKYRKMTGEKVAELLRIDVAALRELVTAKELVPCREIPSEDGEGPSYMFRRNDFHKYAVKLRKRQGLVSSVEAAAIMGVSYSFFQGRWAKRHLSATTLPYGLKTIYFKLKDVLQLKKLLMSTVSGPEAAKMLGIKLAHVPRKLSPVSGRHVDGVGWNRYLKTDVEKCLLEKGVS